MVCIQAHIFYEDLITEIINKTNNIPIKFDLFITTISFLKKNIIEEYIKKYSLANKYEIKIVENKGRDIIPFIMQMKNKVKKYKYFCLYILKNQIMMLFLVIIGEITFMKIY